MTKKRQEKVFVMMSGGVDSSVAALLLQKEKYQVTGVFMKNWSPHTLQSLTDCPWEQDLADAETVAKQLKIPFRSVNFEQEYRSAVVDYFLAEYRAGRTPNPDILCNQKIKFGAFAKWALAHGADKIASGHYARLTKREGVSLVARGQDHNKDQSYFLGLVDPVILEQTIFPVGGLAKSKVRQIARQAGLVVATKKDSQGICFIGQLNVGQFLRDELGVRKGEVVTAEGQVIGEHDGAYLYTIGQRHGFLITKPKQAGESLKINPVNWPPLFVVDKNLAANWLVVSPKKADLAVSRFKLSEPKWYVPVDKLALQVQIRYQGEAVPAVVKRNVVQTKRSVKGLAAGQLAVFYDQNVVVGAGTIERLS